MVSSGWRCLRTGSRGEAASAKDRAVIDPDADVSQATFLQCPLAKYSPLHNEDSHGTHLTRSAVRH